MFGGIGVIAGAVAGAVAPGALPEIFRFISDYRLLTFGAILVLMLRSSRRPRSARAASASGWPDGPCPV